MTKSKKRFSYPPTHSYGASIKPPPISMAGVALDDPIFSKGKGGKGPFRVNVKVVEKAKVETDEARKEGE